MAPSVTRVQYPSPAAEARGSSLSLLAGVYASVLLELVKPITMSPSQFEAQKQLTALVIDLPYTVLHCGRR